MVGEELACTVVKRNLEAVERHDLAAIAATLHQDVIQYYQRPTGRRDDGTLNSDTLVGRDAIIAEIRDHFYVTLYEPGTARITIERLIATQGWVTAQFSLTAITKKGTPYENYYLFLYRVCDGMITQYWEYVDTAYANVSLFMK